MSIKTTPKGSAIFILNTRLDNLELPVVLLNSLKGLNYTNLAEVREDWKTNPKKFERQFGHKNLETLKKIFIENNVDILICVK